MNSMNECLNKKKSRGSNIPNAIALSVRVVQTYFICDTLALFRLTLQLYFIVVRVIRSCNTNANFVPANWLLELLFIRITPLPQMCPTCRTPFFAVLDKKEGLNDTKEK